MSAWLVRRIGGINLAAHLGDISPFRPEALREVKGVDGNAVKSLAVMPLGINFQQLAVNGHTHRGGAQGFLENFFRLQVAAIGQVHIGFRYRVHIAA